MDRITSHDEEYYLIIKIIFKESEIRNRVFILSSIKIHEGFLFYFRPRFVKKSFSVISVRELFKLIPLYRVNKKVSLPSF